MPTKQQRSPLAAGPPWWAALTETRHRLAEHTPGNPVPASQACQWTLAASKSAVVQLQLALRRRPIHAEKRRHAASDLIAGACHLLEQTSRLPSDAHDTPIPPGDLGAALETTLAEHEREVLAAEHSYDVPPTAAEQCADELQRALAKVHDTGHQTRSPHRSAVSLAALLVRAAGNLETTGRAASAAEFPSTTAQAATRRTVEEILTRAAAQHATRNLADCLDAVRHMPAPRSIATLADLTAPPHRTADAREALHRDWRTLAIHLANAALLLNNELPTPSYTPKFASLTDATHQGALNLIATAHLEIRPGTLDHRRAWRHQHIAASRARETYFQAHGNHDSHALRLTQLIITTRLIRATTAITALHLAGRSTTE